MTGDLFTQRRPLNEICKVPDKIISVYSLEQHVWADGNSAVARECRMPEMQTIEEFQIDPVRSFLNDILRQMAAPYNPERRSQPIGQGYWIQAEFGSGKSHLLCFLAALALGDKDAWARVREKEDAAGRGKRESLYRFWEEGLEAKSTGKNRGVFVIVKTLVGQGSGTIGMEERGKRLTEYILDAAKEQLRLETGKNLSLYPTELLADRFLSEDVDRYRRDLANFLRDPRYFDEDEFEDVGEFIRDIQQNKSPDYKRSAGNKLWRFYDEYLKMRPHIPAETEDILKHMVEVIMGEGYSGVLLVLDEVSLFMKNRSEDERTDDEQTLVVLSNRLARAHNLPVWTVCAAQQQIESRMAGVRNIIAEDRLKLELLLKEDVDYYNIVLARVREITDPSAIHAYYEYYRRGFTWPATIGEPEFAHFFPFHKPALEVVRAITNELTTARSAIHFMHQTLKHQIRDHGTELIRLWELFDETVNYEEDPSGVYAGLSAIRTRRESEYLAYESCRRQIEGQTRGALKVYREPVIKTVQTLFLYHLARTRQQGLSPEEIANSVLIERQPDATPDENIQHYETIAESLKRELRQIVETFDEENRPRFRFDPVVTGIDPRMEFRKARDEAVANPKMQQEAWDHLLALDEWPVKTRQITLDLSNGVKSLFRSIAPLRGGGPLEVPLTWKGRQISGRVEMRDLKPAVHDALALPTLNSDESDKGDPDYAVYIGTKPLTEDEIAKLLKDRRDPRILVWTPAELTPEAVDKKIDFAAYRQMVKDWQGKESEDAVAIINWVAQALQSDMGKIARIVDDSYASGRVDALHQTRMTFHVAGDQLSSTIEPLVDRVLTATYESRDIVFEPPQNFKREDGVKVINGIVRSGAIPKNAKPDQNVSAAQNFGLGLKIMQRGANGWQLDVSQNPYTAAMQAFIEQKLADDGQAMSIATLYKNFMGLGSGTAYGLTRRMVQIYLLCLAREGKIRIGVGPKAGLSTTVIDYSTIATIDFSAKVLDGIERVQKMAKPEHWETLRPYAGKLLGEEIPQTQDDAKINGANGYRARLRALFEREKEASVRTEEKARALFETLGMADPYAAELGQMATLFAADLSEDDIDGILFGLKRALDYHAFDTENADSREVDDLANRLRNYSDMQAFLREELWLVAAHAYTSAQYPDLPELRAVRQIQSALAAKMRDLRPYIDSDVQLRTELLGPIGQEAISADSSGDTLAALVRAYTDVYTQTHDAVTNRADAARAFIRRLKASEEVRALDILKGVSVLRGVADEPLDQRLDAIAQRIFSCPAPSLQSVRTALQRQPVHECGLSFENATRYQHKTEVAVAEARQLVDDTLDSALGIFLTPAIRASLSQGAADPVIAALLRFQSVADLRGYLVSECLRNPSVVETINRYLKRVVVKKIRLADFKPASGTIEREQIAEVARQFQQFLERELDSIQQGGGSDGNVLPVLQVE